MYALLIVAFFFATPQTSAKKKSDSQNKLGVKNTLVVYNPLPKTQLSVTWTGTFTLVPQTIQEPPSASTNTLPSTASSDKPKSPSTSPVRVSLSKTKNVSPPKPAHELTVEELIVKTGWAKVENGMFYATTEVDDQKCLDVLTQLKIPWKRGPAKRGIKNPVQLDTYLLNGVYYHWYWAESNDLLLDCRMVLALYMAGPVFRKHGFDEVLYTSSYRYSYISGTRRLSRHAAGMALDVKALRGPGGVVVVVERDWHRYDGTVADCVGPLPLGPARKMRELICEFETLPLFGGILTPDTDYDHRNHFHFGGVLPGETWSRHRAAGRPLTRKTTAAYRYVPTLRYPLPKRPTVLPPWPAGVDPQAPMPTQGKLPQPSDSEDADSSVSVQDASGITQANDPPASSGNVTPSSGGENKAPDNEPSAAPDPPVPVPKDKNGEQTNDGM